MHYAIIYAIALGIIILLKMKTPEHAPPGHALPRNHRANSSQKVTLLAPRKLVEVCSRTTDL